MTQDHDEFDDLKAAFDRVTPRPDPANRAENLALAQKNFAAAQGSAADARPTSVTSPAGLWTGVKTMLNTLTSRGGLTATTAIVACGILILSPAGQDLWRSPQPLGLPEMTPEPAIVEPNTADEKLNDDMASASPTLVDQDFAVEMMAEAPAPAAPRVLRQLPQSQLGGTFADMGHLTEIAPPPHDTETYANAEQNPLKVTIDDPVATFSIDVDTASYGIVRSSLNRGQMPAAEAVRVEELINYFPYEYAAPAPGDAPFQPNINVFETPWNADTQLVHIGLQGVLPAFDQRPPLNLVFLIDTSGSMDDPRKLPLLKQSFRLMLDNLSEQDQVAIVEYAGSAGQVLAPTSATDRTTILQAIQSLGAGGSTNGQGGLEQAYAVAQSMAAEGEVNRVILATDGDFNVGVSDPNGLSNYIADQRQSGTYLSVLGFGRGNLDDATMQALAQNGNGIATYIDTLNEAQKVLVDQLSGALFPIANDVKIQVEFNPAQIAEYRLIGYETRALNREDFNNDAVDAGELGAGHSVTALFEVTPVGSPAQLTDPLRYQTQASTDETPELGFLKLRYKSPGEDESQLIQTAILPANSTDSEAQFAASIAGFGQLLRGNTYLNDWSYGDAIDLANAHRGEDPFGYRTQAVQLMRLAQSLSGQ